MNRKTLCGVLLVSGTVLLTLGMLGDRALSDAMGGMLVGAGSGLLGMGGSRFWSLRYDAKHPQQARQSEIEQRDERNVAIRRRAQAEAGEALQWAVMAAAWISVGLGAPLWVTLTAVGVFVAKSVLELALMVRYQREM